METLINDEFTFRCCGYNVKICKTEITCEYSKSQDKYDKILHKYCMDKKQSLGGVSYNNCFYSRQSKVEKYCER